MKRSVGYALLLLGAASASAYAQDTRPRPVPRKIDPVRVEAWGMPSLGVFSGSIGFGSVEGVLRRKEELNLSSDQVAQIETIRKEEVARRQADSREMIDLQSRMSAGLIDRTEYRDAMEKRSDAQRVAARNVRNRLEDILTDDQLNQIERAPFFGKFQTGPGLIRKQLPPRFDFDGFDSGSFDFDFDIDDFDFHRFNFDGLDWHWPLFPDSELAPLFQSRKFRGGIL